MKIDFKIAENQSSVKGGSNARRTKSRDSRQDSNGGSTNLDKALEIKPYLNKFGILEIKEQIEDQKIIEEDILG